MKKILLTTLTAFTAFTTQAQLQLGQLADYYYSYLYNKSDVAADYCESGINHEQSLQHTSINDWSCGRASIL